MSATPEREQAEALAKAALVPGRVSYGRAADELIVALAAAVSRLEAERDEALSARDWAKAGNASLQYRLGLANDAATAAEGRERELTRALETARDELRSAAAWLRDVGSQQHAGWASDAAEAVREALAGGGRTPPETIGPGSALSDNPVWGVGAAAVAEAGARLPECVERWPECESGAYHPNCCRFPKSCSCEVWPALTTEAALKLPNQSPDVGLAVLPEETP